MRKVWGGVMLVMLAVLIYVLHVYIFIEPDTDDMTNENRIAVQDTAELTHTLTCEDSWTEQSLPMSQSVTAQSLLDSETDMSMETVSVDEPVYDAGIFSWENDAYEPENLASFYLTISMLGIDEVYQDFSGAAAYDESAADFAHEIFMLDVDLYMLTGNSEWTNDDSGAPMISEIARAAAFRAEWGDDALRGIVFDIEPYCSDRWDEGDQKELMENYVSGMRNAYNAAKNEGLRVILCVPTWYDKHYEEYFTQLIQYCDEISVMNYIRQDEYINMVGEVEHARTLDKYITCILEFQQPGKHELSDEKTYYNDGIDAAIASFEMLYRDFGYAKLKLAYHYLKPIREILLER